MELASYEIMHYRLMPDTDTGAFMESVEALNRLLPQFKGFINRNVYLSVESGFWVEVVKWTSREAAKEAEAVIMSMPECKAGFSMVDHDSLFLQHFQLVPCEM